MAQETEKPKMKHVAYVGHGHGVEQTANRIEKMLDFQQEVDKLKEERDRLAEGAKQYIEYHKSGKVSMTELMNLRKLFEEVLRDG